MRHPFIVSISVAFALGLAACGGVTNSRVIARDQATNVSCDWYQMCGKIGTGQGQTYPDRDTCETQVRAQWDSAWPAAMCDSKINQSQLTICLNAINGTECMNGLDILNTLVNKCPQSSICSGP